MGEQTFNGLRPGDVIDGSLEICELIGKGGMGVVWRVHHREWNRDLAVKMPLPALVGSPTARDRFFREAETWIDLGVHPHIVQCWFVKDIQGLPSLFLDYLTGGSLKQWIDQGHIKPGQWQRIIEIGYQVAEGLAHSHSHGVVHRDVKPANLLVRGDERVCVTDFGIVKTAAEPDPETPIYDPKNLPKNLSITGTGAFLGTPQYGAPEQWGSADQVDHAADIYALAVTLYEMCCGRRPFDSDDEEIAPEILIARHLDDKAPDPREFNKDIPTDLAQLLVRSLEKEPKKRPQSMVRMRDSLGSVYQRLSGERYRGVGPLSAVQRPDTLNNKGVSLYSLAKHEEARNVWKQGLRLESGHGECLYNLTQVDLRAARISTEESVRRLLQARAYFPLALLCIEEGQIAQAVTAIHELKGEDDSYLSGPVQRALGDSLMYSGQYYAAEKAYRSALTQMPSDTSAQERKRLASIGKRSLAGKIYFPSSRSTFSVATSSPDIAVTIDDKSSGVIGVTAEQITYWSIQEECVTERVGRTTGATKAQQILTKGTVLLIEDEKAFELRRLPDLSLIGRKSGRVLALTSSLSKLLIREDKGVFLFDIANLSLDQLHLGETSPESLQACFDHQGEQLCLLTENGQVAQLDEEHHLQAESWPERIEDVESVTAMKLSPDGSTLYVGHQDGRMQSFNFVNRQRAMDIQLGKPVRDIQFGPHSNRFLVVTDPGFSIVGSSGSIEAVGDGTATLEQGFVLGIDQGFLRLFGLHPVRQLRQWDQEVSETDHLVFSPDGRQAVTKSKTGSINVWEVDETNRVFKRSFLLSRGQSYSEITTAARAFSEALEKATDALTRDQLGAAYRYLKRARAVRGYNQNPAALNMNWGLLRQLSREQLEAVWERADFNPPGSELPVGPIQISESGRWTSVCHLSTVSVYEDTGKEIRLLWSNQLATNILSSHRVSDHSGGASLWVIDDSGQVLRYEEQTGVALQKFKLGVGPIQRACFGHDRITYLTQDDVLGVYEINSCRNTHSLPNLSVQIDELVSFDEDQPIVMSEGELVLFSLRKKGGRPKSLRPKGYENSSGVSFVSRPAGSPVIHIGYQDGVVLVCQANNMRALKLFGPANGAITAFDTNLDLAIGVGASESGSIIFWDLESGEQLYSFSAHASEILALKIARSGRYLVSSGADYHARLWETSWMALDEERHPFAWDISVGAFGKIGKLFGLGRS